MTIATFRSAAFPTTNWEEIERSLDGLGTECASLDQLVRRYLPPLQRFLSRKGIRPDDVDEILQGFLADKVLSGNLLSCADPGKGRFRSYLVRSLMNYVISETRKAKRGWAGHVQVDSLEVRDVRQDREDYNMSWARQVVSNALELMHRQCDAIARPDVWNVFQGRLIRPAYEDGTPVPYLELMDQHGLDGPTSAFNLLTTAKRMFRRCLQQTVAHYSPHNAEQEMKKLIRVLRQQRARPR